MTKEQIIEYIDSRLTNPNQPMSRLIDKNGKITTGRITTRIGDTINFDYLEAIPEGGARRHRLDFDVSNIADIQDLLFTLSRKQDFLAWLRSPAFVDLLRNVGEGRKVWVAETTTAGQVAYSIIYDTAPARLTQVVGGETVPTGCIGSNGRLILDKIEVLGNFLMTSFQLERQEAIEISRYIAECTNV